MYQLKLRDKVVYQSEELEKVENQKRLCEAPLIRSGIEPEFRIEEDKNVK